MPVAAVAVLLVVLFIRAVSGRRQALVTEKSAREFLKSHEPHLSVAQLDLGENEEAAVILWREIDDIGLLRAFGDKLVLQTFAQSDITRKPEVDGCYQILFPRQGLTHPPLAVFVSGTTDIQSDSLSSEGAIG